MLLSMNVLTHASRCLAYCAAAALDLVHDPATDADTRARAERRLGLLTPLVKAWASDTAVEVSSLGVQVHGGTGYVDDCEASQIYRDARIGPVFEGTNYIQAQDLLGRKILRDRGQAFEELLVQMRTGRWATRIHAQRCARRCWRECAAPARLRAAAGGCRHRTGGAGRQHRLPVPAVAGCGRGRLAVGAGGAHRERRRSGQRCQPFGP